METKRTVVVVGSFTVAAALFYYYYRTRPRRSGKGRNADMDMVKPQGNFKVVLADTSPRPFVHLHTKNHPEQTELHPFYEEIIGLMDGFGVPSEVCLKGPPPMTGDHIWIDTKNKLVDLADILSREPEFAVDTEQHSIRSFLGFTTLIQISTGKQDFLIDAIALHDEMSVLRDVFTDSSIRKVFHGADGDNLWLQKDFHIYIVNLFDTAKACDILGKHSRSLAYLLQTYCGVETNKLFQRADWRLRPLPEEMIVYACTDVHYLLYIASCLQNELLQGDSASKSLKKRADSENGSLYEACVRRCNMMCLQLYEKDAPSHATALLSRYNSNHLKKDDRFQRNLVALCEWRDAIARSADESPRFLLSDRAMLALAATRGPTSAESILSCVSEATEAVAPLDIAQYMTPFPSPSPTLIENLRSLQGILEKSQQHGKGLFTSFWNIIGPKSKSATMREVKDPIEKGKTHGGGPAEEKRVRRTWRNKDYEKARRNFVEKFSCKGPVYQNCRIYAGDGRLLCFCDRKKLDWYVDRGLAEFMDEDPPAIKLCFEPKRRPEDENNDFYIQSKSNSCVGCGESNHYLRYRVIPSCYRQYFPQHLKSHRSHDIVLLCVDCHEVAHRAAEKYKKQVALKYGVPLFAKRVVDLGTNGASGFQAHVVDGGAGGVSPKQLRAAAVALLNYGTVMPKQRREDLEGVVQAFYGGRTITQEDIQAALRVSKGTREPRRRHRMKGLPADKVVGPKEDDASGGQGQILAHTSVSDHVTTPDSQKTNDVNVSYAAAFGAVPNGKPLIERVGPHDELQRSSQSADAMEYVNGDNAAPQDSDDDQEPLDVAVCTESGDGSLVVIRDALEECGVFLNTGVVEKLLEVSYGRKQKQRESLLGHGPHGKKVVEIILEADGEDGIFQFCQMWRSVFVDSVKPTNLPTFWDILHSGRRDFGEYSIYNPARAPNE